MMIGFSVAYMVSSGFKGLRFKNFTKEAKRWGKLVAVGLLGLSMITVALPFVDGSVMLKQQNVIPGAQVKRSIILRGRK